MLQEAFLPGDITADFTATERAPLDLGACCVTMDTLLNLSDEAVISILYSESYFKGKFAEGTKSTSPVSPEHRVPGHVTLSRVQPKRTALVAAVPCKGSLLAM